MQLELEDIMACQAEEKLLSDQQKAAVGKATKAEVAMTAAVEEEEEASMTAAVEEEEEAAMTVALEAEVAAKEAAAAWPATGGRRELLKIEPSKVEYAGNVAAAQDTADVASGQIEANDRTAKDEQNRKQAKDFERQKKRLTSTLKKANEAADGSEER